VGDGSHDGHKLLRCVCARLAFLSKLDGIRNLRTAPPVNAVLCTPWACARVGLQTAHAEDERARVRRARTRRPRMGSGDGRTGESHGYILTSTSVRGGQTSAAAYGCGSGYQPLPGA
jgi:hypothetical protein